jgi:hypothetical protein
VGWSVKFAVTDVADVIVTTQLPVPVQPPPDHPLNVEPVDGVATSVTIELMSNIELHDEPQLMPAGVESTEPLPLPVLLTVSENCLRVNVAVTCCTVSVVTMQVPVPVHAPLQPVNVESAAAVAVSVTIVPGANIWLHVVPQSMPAGLDVTEPLPLPSLVTTTLFSSANDALTVVSAFTVTLQVAVVPEQPPCQPANTEPESAVSLSITTVPTATLTLHCVPQSMPLDELTVPEPLLSRTTVSVTVWVCVSDDASSGDGLPILQTPETQCRPGGHVSSGPHWIFPSLNCGEKHAESETKTIHQQRNST